MSTNRSLLNETIEHQTAGHGIILVFELCAIPVIVCGNLLIVIAMLRFKSLRYPSNMMILYLSFTDLMMGGLYLPLKVSVYTQTHLFQIRTSCLLNIFISLFCVSNAMSFLSMISIERFYAVHFPFHYHSYMTVPRTLVWGGLTCVISLLITIPSVCGIDLWRPGKHCFTTNIMPRYYLWSGVFVVFLISFLGFMAFLRVMAAEIMIRMRDRNVNETRKQDSVKSTLMLTVYVFSIICWIPQLVYTCISAFSPTAGDGLSLRTVSFLGICSSGVNCFIYGIKNSKFRAAFKTIFGCKSPSIDVQETTEITTIHTDA